MSLYSILMILCSCELFVSSAITIAIDRNQDREYGLKLEDERLRYWNGEKTVSLSLNGSEDRMTYMSLVLPNSYPFVLAYTGFVHNIPVLHAGLILLDERLFAQGYRVQTVTLDFTTGKLAAILIQLAEKGYEISRVDLARLVAEIRSAAEGQPYALIEEDLVEALLADRMHTRLLQKKRFPLPEVLQRELQQSITWYSLQGQQVSSETTFGEGLYYLFEKKNGADPVYVELRVDAEGHYSYLYFDSPK